MAKNPNQKLSTRYRDAQSQLVTQTADLPLGTLADMVKSGAIDLQPSFQRRERWDKERQSALIESFLLNVPVPPIYLSEEADGTYGAIDGKQRLSSIAAFIGGELKLTNLEKLTEAEGLSFKELPEEIQNAFRLRPFLRVVTLLKQTQKQLKYEVFLRLNRGGERLNAQEIRNVAYRGPLNSVIYKLAENKFFRSQLKIKDTKSEAFKQMVDAEFVLRFLTLRDQVDAFSGKLVREMDKFMADNQNANKDQVQLYEKQFTEAMSRCEALWGEHAFRRPDGDGWRDQFLAGMYDAQMVAVSHLSRTQYIAALNARNKVIAATRRLFNDSTFEEYVRTGTNTPNRIIYRVKKIRELLQRF